MNISLIFKKYLMIFILIILIALFSVINPVFFSVSNLVNILIQQSYIFVAVTGLSFVMIGGGMDLSIGYQISLVSVVTAICMMWFNLPIVFAILVGLILGVFLGCINGIATIKLNVHPLIITLGTMTIFQGVSYIISKSNPIFGLPDMFKFIGQGYVGPIPFCFIIVAVCAVVGSFILSKTYIGRYVYAVGSNEEAARLTGVNVNLVKLFIFALSSFFVSIAAIMLVARAGSANSGTGVGTEFTCMTAAILGGISFKGGSGKIWGALIGASILGVLSNGMQIVGLGAYPQYIAKGIVLLAAVGFDEYQKRIKMKRSAKAIA